MKCFIYCIFGGNTNGKSQRCNKKSKTTFKIIFRSQNSSHFLQNSRKNSKLKDKTQELGISIIPSCRNNGQKSILAYHVGKGGEDLDGPGSCPDPISFWVHKNPVHIWQDDWGDLGDLSIGQVSREFFQNTDGSLNSKFVACKKMGYKTQSNSKGYY